MVGKAFGTLLSNRGPMTVQAPSNILPQQKTNPFYLQNQRAQVWLIMKPSPRRSIMSRVINIFIQRNHKGMLHVKNPGRLYGDLAWVHPILNQVSEEALLVSGTQRRTQGVAKRDSIFDSIADLVRILED